jgi:cell surface protein SprA
LKNIPKLNSFVLKLTLLVVFFNIYNTNAQTDEDSTTPTDTIGYHKGRLTIANPPSVVELYKYDPVTDRYIFSSTVTGLSVNYPIILSPAEYRKRVLKESIHKYFKEKEQAVAGQIKGSEDKRRNLIPRMYVNSGLFTTIFGSNTIDIKPTGSVEIDLGMRYTMQDNPALTPQNRSSTTFDFNQRISVGMQGKVGTRLGVNFNYDTQSTFAFQNLFKLEFNPGDIGIDGVGTIDDAKNLANKAKNFKDNIPKSVSGTNDDILQKIELGNISMPLSSSLIRGAQSLFGVKAQFKFGKTMITALYSEQKSQTKTVTSENGGTVQLFDLFALDYDADRHFFLSQYFRNNYDKSLKSYPVIDSRVQITRVEVWITNKQNRVNNVENNNRNIVAIQDLGEGPQTGYLNSQIVGSNSLTWTGPGVFFNTTPADSPADNANNQYNPAYLSTTPPSGTGILNLNIRDIANVNSGFTGFPPGNAPSQGKDFSILENARKLTANEFTFHPQLGYISLQQKLNNDEVLAVAYQYTIGEKVYQVGEFGNDGVAATTVSTTGVPNTQSLVLKMLKSTLTNTTQPMWNLMMKNIYQIPQAYQLQAQDFRFNIVYSDPSPLNYIKLDNSALPTVDNVSNRPLLNVFNLDRLSAGNDVQPLGDGFFDFIPGLTVDAQNARIIFTTIEPFGKHLFEKLRNNVLEDYYATGTSTYNVNQAKYVYKSLYTGTQTQALQDAGKNKFELKGKYKASGGDGIPIGAVNVPKGSVVVTAGGRKLTEGLDYTVNYQQGRVQILDPSLQASGTPIQVSVENNSIFGQQTRRFYGLNVEHKFSDKFMIGGTFLRMVERPLTQKSTYGQESVNNTIYGLNGAFATEVPFLTRLVNKLPNIDTDVPSNISVKAEVAYLSPDTPTQDKFNGEATIYVDDFEGSQSNIDLRSPAAWQFSSVPENITADYNFVTQVSPSNPLGIGYKRAKINWYTIDPTFYQGSYDVSSNETRRIYITELYPNQQNAVGQTTLVPTFDLSYYPSEKGPYNNDPQFITNNKKSNFGGLMRAINSTNFEQSNVEYIQFWLLDPTLDDRGLPKPINNGKIFFNLGEISEDILQDGHKQYENGLPAVNSTTPALPVAWGKIPTSTSLIYAFDNDAANRAVQDLGYDGITDKLETAVYTNFDNPNDPANDNYQFFGTANGNILERYKNYNNPQGNSPVDITNNNRGNSTLPDAEDVNRDNTMNTINAYFEYSIDIDPTKMTVASGGRYITDDKVTTITTPDGNQVTGHWIQYKIPIANPERNIGGISDFRSIRFMRMFMTGFDKPLTVRFGALDLIRGEWRRYNNLLSINGTTPGTPGTNFDVTSVSINENNFRVPIRYVLPPGVTRELLANGNSTIAQNEKSLSLRISGNTGLIPQDSRAVFKNVNIDMRQYKSLKMFIHAESLPTPVSPLLDNEMSGFIRFGNDFTDNFYQVELPLKVSAPTAYSETEIWPEDNNLDLAMKDLTALKIRAIQNDPNYPPDANGIRYMKVGNTKIGIKGNPNFGLVRTLMVGLKNNTPDGTTNPPLTAKNITGEVWFDELRLAGIDNKGGMAAVANVESNLADFATFSATGKMSTIGFGALEQGTNERSREDLKLYDLVTNLSLGQLLPKKWGVRLPFNFGVGEQIITPKYDPFNLDIELKQLIDITPNQADKDKFLDRAIDYTKRNSINFIGVKKDRTGSGKQHIYDIENFTLSNSFNQTLHHDFEI